MHVAEGGASLDSGTCSAGLSGSTRWVPVKLTFVSYPEGDSIGHILAWFSLAPVLLITATLGVLLFRREVQIIVFLSGIFINEAINQVAKRLINQPRPCSQHDMSLQHSDRGMPSAHAQFIFFFSTYLSLFVSLRVPHLQSSAGGSSCSSASSMASTTSAAATAAASYIMSTTNIGTNNHHNAATSTASPNGHHHHHHHANSVNHSPSISCVMNVLGGCWWKIVINCLLFSLAVIVSYSRVYLLYHTWAQISVGTFCGILFAVLWYLATVLLFVPRYNLLVSNAVGEFLMLRDSSLIPNVLLFEYVKGRTEAQARLRKLNADHCS